MLQIKMKIVKLAISKMKKKYQIIKILKLARIKNFMEANLNLNKKHIRAKNYI